MTKKKKKVFLSLTLITHASGTQAISSCSAFWSDEGYFSDILNHLEGLRVQFPMINIC